MLKAKKKQEMVSSFIQLLFKNNTKTFSSRLKKTTTIQ